MVCSHCGGVGHYYRRCPTITPEQKSALSRENKEKRRVASQRRQIRLRNYQRILNEQRIRYQNEEQLVNFKISNMTCYDVVLYKQYNGCDYIERIAYMSEYSRYINWSCLKSRYSIYAFPLIEVYDHSIPDNNRAIEKIKISISENGEIQFPYTCLLNLNLKDFDGDSIVIDCDYKPKTEVEQWRECALKSKFLLDQIFQMTGGGKTLKAYENIEPFLDMVDDINVPTCTEFEKEMAGVPSLFTNVT